MSALPASEFVLAATRLRNLNERQAREGVARLRRAFKAQQEAGIIDGKGSRLRPERPPSKAGPSSDVV